MRLIGILISVCILAYLLMFTFKRLYTPQPNSAGLDTSLPAVNKQVENLQNTTKMYDDNLKKQQDLLKPVK